MLVKSKNMPSYNPKLGRKSMHCYNWTDKKQNSNNKFILSSLSNLFWPQHFFLPNKFFPFFFCPQDLCVNIKFHTAPKLLNVPCNNITNLLWNWKQQQQKTNEKYDEDVYNNVWCMNSSISIRLGNEAAFLFKFFFFTLFIIFASFILCVECRSIVT